MEEERDAINRSGDGLQDMPAIPHETGTKRKVCVPSSKRRIRVRLDQSRRSDNRQYHKLVENFQIPEFFPALSIRMSDVLADIGAGKCTVMERRETFLRRECMQTIYGPSRKDSGVCFFFGSQSEGTTTPGLNSDIDWLRCYGNMNIMTEWRDWEAGMYNLLMLQDEITPPQQYLLQAIGDYTSKPFASSDIYVRKDSGQVLFSSERWKMFIEHFFRKEKHITNNGPSVSSIPNTDMVWAFHVCKPLHEIQHWIDRCRGRHWPSAELLEAARVAPSFLVPAGHPESDFKREEWRLSPNLIERMLMFSFNTAQIKCYIVLKLIKKSLFNKMVGECITSFHCKTLMFYTIERIHPSLWKEHNLMFLLVLCLNILKKWLRLRRIPHYIIEGVNLFDGKVSLVQQRRLLQYVNYLIKNDLQDLFHIDIDKFGYQLRTCGIWRFGQSREGGLPRVCLRKSISLLLKFEGFSLLRLYTLYDLYYSNSTFDQYLNYKLRVVFENSTNALLKTVALDFINQLYALYNSVALSKCLRLLNSDVIEFIRRFKYSCNTDVASSYLKLASTLYCCGHLHAAMIVLEDVEKRYHSKVKAVCGCRSIEGDRDLQVFANMITDNGNNAFKEPPFALCVKFVRPEAYCAPYILLFEMNRGMTEDEVAQRRVTDRDWMDCAEVDARPFLHYLQYLTYGGLGELDKQLHAMEMLESYLLDPRNRINIYHSETAMNLVGHCYEMEGDYRQALECYEISLRCWGMNNAAHWHVLRVQRLISYG